MSLDRAPKLLHLEALRGIACLMVVVSHLVMAFWPWLHHSTASDLVGRGHWSQVFSAPPLNALHHGTWAVMIFFVLSGFVLSYAYWQRPTPETIASAAIRRYFRLTPPILVATLLATLVFLSGIVQVNAALIAMRTPDWLPSRFDHTLIDRSVFDHSFAEAARLGLYGALLGHGHTKHYLGVLWTMRIEFLGSALVYAMLGIFGTVRRRGWIYAVVALLLLRNGDHFMLQFLAGIALADAFAHHRHPPAWIAAGCVALGLFGGSIQTGIPLGSRVFGEIAIPSFGAILLVGGVCFWPRLARLLSARPLVTLGAWSFAIYLTHELVLQTATMGMYASLRTALPHDAGALAASALSFPLVLAVAWPVYRWVDQPSVTLGRFVYRHWFSVQATDTTRENG